jgi:hypothetical protein
MTGLIAGREEMRNVCKTVFGKLKMYWDQLKDNIKMESRGLG